MPGLAILNIGTELTRGELTNTNATWIAERFTSLGFDVGEIEVVADDRPVIVATLQRLGAAFDVIVVSGGLGPTSDDFTSECAAVAIGVPMERDEAALEAIRRRFVAIGRPMSPSNERQADFPRGAEVLSNPIGSAPGFAIDIGRARAFFTPGVPVEMQRMVDEQIVPRTAHLAPNDTAQLHLKCFGETESRIGETLAGVEETHPGVTIGYRAHFPEIEVKVHARGASRADAMARAEAAAKVVRQRLGELVYAEGATETFAGSIARKLRSLGVNVAIAESCTGGLLGTMLTQVPGASEFLLLDAVVYSNQAKTVVLGVDPELLCAHGAVSSECAGAMASGVRRVSGADVSVSVTGIAGPGGATDTKPVGLVYIATASSLGVQVKEHHMRGDRVRIQQLAAYAALRSLVHAAQKAAEAKRRGDASVCG